MSRLQQGLREAGLLLIVAVALGCIYTAATEKGLFARFPHSKTSLETDVKAPVRISLDQAWNLYQTSSPLFIDARHEFDFKQGHIKGAVNLPLTEFDARKAALDGIPRDRLIVAYCDGEECNSSIELSVKLMKDGFTDVKIFFGGWREWEAAKHPTEKSS